MTGKHHSLGRRLLRFFAGLFTALLVVLVGCTIVGLVYLNRIGVNPVSVLAQPLDYAPALTSEIYDRNGVLLAQLWKDEFRYYVPYERIPAILVKAVIATEDKSYWVHRGVDMEGAFRAVLANLRSGTIQEGGSTITQQLATALFLTPDQTMERKVKEAILAMRLEATYPKQKIMEMYLNQVFFGKGAYGVEAASLSYFGIHVQQLSLAQAALLAGLIAAPNGLSPYRNPEGAKARQAEVLSRMERLGMITEDQMEQALQSPLEYHDTSVSPWKAPYFVDYVIDLLLQEYGPTMVYQGGLRVTTSLDIRLQEAAEQAAAEGVQKWQEQGAWPADLVNASGVPQPQLALVAIDPRNGELLAMVGGTSYEKSKFNRVVQAQRQPGSSFKIFDYSTALESGTLRPSDILVSEPIDINGWQPSEYRESIDSTEKRYYGALTVRQALVQSSNIAAIKVTIKAGLENVIAMAHAMGITADLQPYPALAIGAQEVKPIEMAQAYGVLADGGLRAQPRPILRITRWDDSLVKEYKPAEERVLSFRTAYQMTDYFQSVIRPTEAYIEGLPSAGKTGTTDRLRDAWFCGYTPVISCVVWTGADSDDVPFYTRYNIGMHIPASIWRLFMQKATAILPTPDFPPYEEENSVERLICMASGRLAGPYCPEDQLVWETFMAGTEPTRLCNIHREPVETPTVTILPVSPRAPWSSPTPTPSPSPTPTLAPPVLSPSAPSLPPDDIQSLLSPSPLPSPTPTLAPPVLSPPPSSPASPNP
jgi:penicillin-binding protein 1A